MKALWKTAMVANLVWTHLFLMLTWSQDISVHCKNCGLTNPMGKYCHNLSSKQPSLVLIKPSALKDAKDTSLLEFARTAVTGKMYVLLHCL